VGSAILDNPQQFNRPERGRRSGGMERLELEQQLLAQGADQEAVAGLRLDNRLPAAAGPGEPVSDGQRVGGSPAGDIAVARARDGGIRWQDVVAFLPEFANASAERFLDAMRDRYRDDPSDDNADLLLAAINRIGASERLRHTHLVEGAKELLQTGEGLADPAKADGIWFEVYTDVDFGGPEWFTLMTPGWAYWRTPDFRNVRAIYANVMMQDVVSSIQYGSSPDEVGGQVVLFEHVRYDGRYRNFTVAAGKDFDVPWIGNDFNDTTSSSLIVRRFPDELPPMQLSQIIPKATITSILADVPRVSPDGDPIYTWDMWPNGPKSNLDWHPNDDHAFVEIIVPVTIDLPIPFAPDYRAQVKYWILPFVRDGRLAATVAYWGYWVEGGMYTDVVAARLKDALPRTVGMVQGRVDAAIGRLGRLGRLAFCYLLPGRNEERGHVFDDVTIVAVR
jgi:hypothetical protein